MTPANPRRALFAELMLVGLLIAYGPFSVFRLLLLTLIASQSLWLRGSSWRTVGLRRPTSVKRTVLIGVCGAMIILLANRLVLLPLIERFGGSSPDLSALGEPGDIAGLMRWLAQAWTLAAFVEEMVFRGYLINRITDLVGDTRVGSTVAVVLGGAAFGVAHAYQGPAGVIATGAIGCFLGFLYVRGNRNLWVVILCHAVVDTIGLLAIYFDQRWVLLL
jgi:membrane protease YdiL (CAAX protease family)